MNIYIKQNSIKAKETTANLDITVEVDSLDGATYQWSGTANGKIILYGTSSSDKINIPDVAINNLKSGEKNSIDINISCERTISNEQGAFTESASKNITIDIYTHPGAWSWGALPEELITNIITVKKVTDWREHFQKVYHWQIQDDKKYSFKVKIKEDDPVTADWYNECADALNNVFNKKIDRVTGGVNGTLISAQIINKLNFTGIT